MALFVHTQCFVVLLYKILQMSQLLFSFVFISVCILKELFEWSYDKEQKNKKENFKSCE